MGKKIKELEERIDVIEKNLSKLQEEREYDIRFSSMEGRSEGTESVGEKNLGSNKVRGECNRFEGDSSYRVFTMSIEGLSTINDVCNDREVNIIKRMDLEQK